MSSTFKEMHTRPTVIEVAKCYKYFKLFFLTGGLSIHDVSRCAVEHAQKNFCQLAMATPYEQTTSSSYIIQLNLFRRYNSNK